MNNEVQGEESPKKKSRVFRILKRLMLFSVFTFVLLFSAALVIGYYYRDEVKGLIVRELNKQLNTQVIIDGKDIDFTVIKNFPYASLDFKSIKALDATDKPKKDTLFSAGKVSLQFNILDIFRKKYEIKKVEIHNANLALRIDKNGKDNYHFWKATEQNSQKNTSFSFALKKIVLKQVSVLYKNRQTNQSLDVFVKNSTSSGKFSATNYLMQTNSDMTVNDFSINKTNYLNKKHIEVELELNVDNSIASYKLKQGKIKIEDVLLEISGSVINTTNEAVVNLGVQGKDMGIRSVLSLIPKVYKNKIDDYESAGEFYFNAIVEGAVSKNKMPVITADFGINGADIKQVKNNILLHNVQLKGHYYSGGKNANDFSSLELAPFSVTIESADLSGELRLQNLSNPYITTKLKGEIPLDKLQDFVHIDTIESITGLMHIDADFKGDISEFEGNNYRNINASGTLVIENMDVKIKNNTLLLAALNGDFRFENNNLQINNFTGNVSNSDFLLKGSLKNFIGFLVKENEDIFVDATFYSKKLNLNELLANKEEEKSSDSKYKLKFSEHINVRLNSSIDNLIFRKFEATAIKGVVKLKDKKMFVDSLLFSTMGGKVAVGGLVDAADSAKLLVTCFADIHRVNITQLFTSFENFNQTYITDKNLKGHVNAKIQFASVFTPELDIDLNHLYAGIDMSVENGEMNNVESMKSLSRFIELSELENIRFSTLKNQLEIKDKLITIPKMDIKTNALNFFASGTHDFENQVNYKIKLSLNELLAKKIKKPKEKDNEFGEIADDGLGRTNVFLSMTGYAGNPVIRYDAKSAVENLKQDLKVEKQTLKKILNEEFGLFKKDTSLQKTTNIKKEDEKKFIIKWDEAEVKEPEKKELKKPKRKEEDDF